MDREYCDIGEKSQGTLNEESLVFYASIDWSLGY